MQYIYSLHRIVLGFYRYLNTAVHITTITTSADITLLLIYCNHIYIYTAVI